MKVLDLKLQAFGPFLKEQHIPFESLNNKGMFLINGPTGTGKTSIFDAIVFALYGQGSGKDRVDSSSMRSDLADDQTPTFVELKFEANGQVYIINRKMAYMRKSMRGGGLTLEPASAELIMPDKSVISSLKSVNATIQEKILFINREQFKSVALLAQGEFTELITASSKDRGAILEHIFQKEIYDTFQTKLLALTNKAEEENKEIISSINTLIAQVENGEQIICYKEAIEDSNNIPSFLDNLGNTIKQLESNLKTHKEISLKAQKEFIEAQGKLTTLKTNNELISKYLASLNKLEELKSKEKLMLSIKKLYDVYQEYKQTEPLIKQVNEIKNKIEEAQKSIIDIASKKEELKKVAKSLLDNKESYEFNKEALNKENNIFTNLSNLSKAKEPLLKAKEIYNKKDDEFASKYSKMEEIEKKYLFDRKLFFASSSFNLAKELKDGEPCPVCGSLSHPHLASSTKAISEIEFKQTEETYNKAKEAVETLKNELASLKASFEQKELQMIDVFKNNGFKNADKDFIYSCDINKLILESNIKINKLTSSVESYETKKNKYDIDKAKVEEKEQNEKKALNDLKVDLDNTQKALDNKLKENKLFKDLKEVDSLKKVNPSISLDSYTKYNDEKNAALAVIKATPEQLVKVGKIDESELISKASSKKAALDEANSRVNNLDNSLKNLKKSQSSILTKFNECKESIEKYSSLSELSKTATGANRMHLSFKMYILADYFDKIIFQANKRLSRITNGRYKLVRSLVTKGNAQQGLDLDVYDVETGKNRSASSLSGGEKFVSALSMALGLSDIIETNHALIQVESIFIDEGFGSLDENYLDMAMKALESLKDDNKTVAIISHVEKLKEYIPDGLEVKKTTEGLGSMIITKSDI